MLTLYKENSTQSNGRESWVEPAIQSTSFRADRTQFASLSGPHSTFVDLAKICELSETQCPYMKLEAITDFIKLL